jgi:hypothetical protein
MPWLPLTILLFVIWVPRKYEAVCTRSAVGASPACRLEVTKGVWMRSIPFVRLEAEVGTITLSNEKSGQLWFDVHDPRPVVTAYNAFQTDPSALDFRWSLGETGWYWVILGAQILGEIGIVLFFRIRQREIRIDVEPKTGLARISKTHAAPIELDLGQVAHFTLEDLDAVGQAVIAKMKEGAVDLRLFETTDLEAEAGREFLDRERERWQSQ